MNCFDSKFGGLLGGRAGHLSKGQAVAVAVTVTVQWLANELGGTAQPGLAESKISKKKLLRTVKEVHSSHATSGR